MGRGSGRDQSRSLLEDTAILLGTDEPAAVPAFVGSTPRGGNDSYLGDGLTSIARPQSPRTGRQHQSDQGVNENLFHDPLLEKGFPERPYSGTGGNRFCDEGHVLAESIRLTAP